MDELQLLIISIIIESISNININKDGGKYLCAIYGGYVRFLVAGGHLNDLDMWFCDDVVKERFFEQLQNMLALSCVANRNVTIESVEAHCNYCQRKYHIVIDGEKVLDIDVNVCEINNLTPDLSINALMVLFYSSTCGYLLEVMPSVLHNISYLTVDIIKEHIVGKYAVWIGLKTKGGRLTMNQCSKQLARIGRFMGEGYEITNIHEIVNYLSKLATSTTKIIMSRVG